MHPNDVSLLQRADRYSFILRSRILELHGIAIPNSYAYYVFSAQYSETESGWNVRFS